MPKDWYDNNFFLNVFWTLTAPIYWPFKLVTGNKPKWVRWWGNRVDNLWDDGKEFLHCKKIPGTNKQINISRFMKNRDTWGEFIRPHKNWCNCDPEDFPGEDCINEDGE